MSRAAIQGSASSDDADVRTLDQRGGFQRRQRLRHRMRQFGQRDAADRVILAVAAPFEEFVEHTERRQRARQTPAADLVVSARREEPAHVPRTKPKQLRHIRQAIEMSGKESEELGDVACIGFGGICRELPLGRKIVEPRLDRLAHIRRAHHLRRFGLLCHASGSPDSGHVPSSASELLYGSRVPSRPLTEASRPWSNRSRNPKPYPCCCRSLCLRPTTISCRRA